MQNFKCFIVLFISSFRVTDSVYYGNKHQRMKHKLMYLDKELVLESIRNVERVDHLKKHYSDLHGYEIGQIVYDIRSKYARMVRLYMLSHDNFALYDHNTHILHLNEMHHLSMDIKHFIEMIEISEASKNSTRKVPSNAPTPPVHQFTTPGGSPPNSLRQRGSGYIVRKHVSNMSMFMTTKKYTRDRTDFNNDGGGFDSDVY